MNVKFSSYDKFNYIFHFSISPNTVKSYFKSFLESGEFDYTFDDMVENNETPFFNYIEQVHLNDAIEELGIITTTVKKVIYFNKYTVNRPIIGVVKALGIRYDYELQVPKKIQCSLINGERLKSQFNNKLLANGLFYKKATDSVKDNSVFIYDLKYTSNGALMSVISNQEYDMQVDNDFDNTLFLSANIGDNIIINNGDVTTTLEIKEIYNKSPYSSELYDKKKIKSLGFEDFKEFENKYIDVAKRYNDIIAISNEYCRYFKSINEIEIKEELKTLYEDLFDIECNENVLILDLLSRWYQYNNESNFPELFIDAFYECKIYDMRENAEQVHFENIISYLNSRVIEKCLMENNVKIEYI